MNKLQVEIYTEHTDAVLRVHKMLNTVVAEGEVTQTYVKLYSQEGIVYIPWHRIHRVAELPEK